MGVEALYDIPDKLHSRNFSLAVARSCLHPFLPLPIFAVILSERGESKDPETLNHPPPSGPLQPNSQRLSSKPGNTKNKSQNRGKIPTPKNRPSTRHNSPPIRHKLTTIYHPENTQKSQNPL
jgi:hypothetical protein